MLVLSGRLRLIPIDNRGHGDAPVPPGPYTIEELGRDVLALLDRMELERASFCGLSLGGMVGQWLGANAADRIDRLVLVCTAAHLPPASKWSKRAYAVRAAGSTEVIADEVVEAWFTPGWAQAHPLQVNAYRRMLVDTPVEGYAGCCEAIADFDLRAELPNIEAPTLVISAGRDGATPPKYGREIADGIPGARFELLEVGAHLASVERADLLSGLIAAHVLAR